MEVKIFKTISNFLKQDFNTALSAGYISLVIVGMLFQGSLYLLFNINIVQYSDISDFLLAPFREPAIIFFTAFTIGFMYAFTIFDNWLDKNHPNVYDLMMMGMNKTKYEHWYANKGALLVFLSYVYFSAVIYGTMTYKTVKNATSSKTQIVFKDNKFEPNDTLIYIGKTNAYVFLYNRTKKQADIVPMGDVLRLEVKR